MLAWHANGREGEVPFLRKFLEREGLQLVINSYVDGENPLGYCLSCEGLLLTICGIRGELMLLSTL